MKRGDYSAKRYLQFSLVIFSLLVLLTSALAEPVDASRAAAAARGWYELRFERDAEQQPAGVLYPSGRSIFRVTGIWAILLGKLRVGERFHMQQAEEDGDEGRREATGR